MVLNYIWIGLILVAFVFVTVQTLFTGNIAIWSEVVNSTFSSAKTAFDISLGLTGVLSLWLGLMKVGEKGGVVEKFAKIVNPLFSRLFPGIPKNHPAMGSIFMNLSANMLGLDNAATPLGLKAMKEMQEINKEKDVASDAMIMFLVLNTSGLTLIPISVMMYRAQLGAANPSDIFLPILIATFFSTIAGIIACCVKQKINMIDKVILGTILGLSAVIFGIMILFSNMSQENIAIWSSFISNFILFSIITGFILAGVIRKINVFDTFIEGAKEGFQTAVMIIPYLVAMLVAIGLFRSSGAMSYLTDGIASIFGFMGISSDFVEALPTAIMKPLSGSGARGMMVDAIKTHGADSFVGRVASTIQGATDTTLYILAVYFGSIGISKTRYAAGVGLFADLVGIIAAIFVSYIFFG